MELNPLQHSLHSGKSGLLSIVLLAEVLQIREASYVYIKNGSPVTSDEIVTPDDDLKFLEIFSGG